MNTFDMRPRTVGEVLDGAVKLYVRNARLLITIVAAVVVPVQIICAIVLFGLVHHGENVPGNLFGVFSFHVQTIHVYGVTERRVVGPHANPLAEFIVDVLGNLMSLLCVAACVRAISEVYLDRETSVGQSLRFVAVRLPVLIVLAIVRDITVAAGLILLIVGACWLYVSFAVAIPAMMVERRGPFSSLGRSFRLVRGRWWASLGILLVSSILAGLVTSALQALFHAVDGFSSNPSLGPAVLALTLGAAVAAILVQPFTAAVITLLYFDLRVRHEGFDLQVLADHLGLPAPAPGAGAAWQPGEPPGRDQVGTPGGPPFWPPPPDWQPPAADAEA